MDKSKLFHSNSFLTKDFIISLLIKTLLFNGETRKTGRTTLPASLHIRISLLFISKIIEV